MILMMLLLGGGGQIFNLQLMMKRGRRILSFGSCVIRTEEDNCFARWSVAVVPHAALRLKSFTHGVVQLVPSRFGCNGYNLMRKSIVITCSIQEVPAGFSLQNSNSKVYLVVFFKIRGAVTNICIKMKSILLLLFTCCCIIIIVVEGEEGGGAERRRRREKK